MTLRRWGCYRAVMLRHLLAAFALMLLGSVPAPDAGERAHRVLITMPSPWFDPAHPLPETTPEREARIGRVAVEVAAQVERIDDETGLLRATGWSRDDIVAAAAVLAYTESAFAWEVHAGAPWPGRPAPFGDKGRARCLFQLQVGASQVPRPEFRPFVHEEHQTLAGLDEAATRRCVRAGVRALAWQAWRCRGKLASARWGKQHSMAVLFTEYRRPGSCDAASSQAISRAFAWKTFRYRMRSKRSG